MPWPWDDEGDGYGTVDDGSGPPPTERAQDLMLGGSGGGGGGGVDWRGLPQKHQSEIDQAIAGMRKTPKPVGKIPWWVYLMSGAGDVANLVSAIHPGSHRELAGYRET